MQRLIVDKIVSVGAVDLGDNPGATLEFWKRRDVEEEPEPDFLDEIEADLEKRKFSQDQRDRAASRGAAMPDGSYPIENVQDLRNAIQAFGRAKNPAKVKAHIIRRARSLGQVGLLPDSWQVSKQEPAAETAEQEKEHRMGDLDLSGLEEELREQIEAHITAEVEKQVAEQAPEPEEEEDVLKTAPEEVQTLVKNLQDELASERLEKQRTEWIGKAEPLADLLGDAKEIGELLRELDAAAPEATGKLYPTLEAASQRLEMGELFKEKGKSGAEEPTYESRRDAWVKENRTEGESLAEANARFAKEHPDAVRASREEQ